MLQGLLDPVKEKARLQKKYGKLQKEAAKVRKAMAFPGYAEKSPPHVQQTHQAKVGGGGCHHCLRV